MPEESTRPSTSLTGPAMTWIGTTLAASSTSPVACAAGPVNQANGYAANSATTSTVAVTAEARSSVKPSVRHSSVPVTRSR